MRMYWVYSANFAFHLEKRRFQAFFGGIIELLRADPIRNYGAKKFIIQRSYSNGIPY